jgi:hypothetical protein
MDRRPVVGGRWSRRVRSCCLRLPAKTYFASKADNNQQVRVEALLGQYNSFAIDRFKFIVQKLTQLNAG